MDTVELIEKIGFFYREWGYFLVFISSFIEITPLGWSIPGGVILAVGGFFAYDTGLSLLGIILFGWFGAWFTLVLSYYLGATTGYALLKRFNKEKSLDRAKKLLNNHGAVILTTSLLANLTRFWVAYLSGIQKYNFYKFLFYSGTASLTWVCLMVFVGYLAGSERGDLETALSRLGILSWVILLTALYIIYKKSKDDFVKFKDEFQK